MASTAVEFLSGRDPVTWVAPAGFPGALRPDGLFAQEATHGLEVVLARAVRRPAAADLRQAWAKRRAGRVSPVLLVAVYPVHGEWKTSLCGPVGDQPAVHHGIEMSQAERLAAVALDEPNRHAATRFLLAALPELESDMPGLRNVGLLATQELQAGVPEMPAWEAAVRQGRPLLGLRGRPLVERLGFGVDVLSTNTSLLTVNGRNRAIAVFCDEDEPFDAPAQRFDGTSPVSRGLAVADQHNVDWVVLTRAAEIRLYAARPDTGVGRKGRAETFVELNLSLLPADLAGYLHLLFSADALGPGGTTDQILKQSADFASNLAVRLRERVYFETVPALAQAIAARLGHQPSESELDDAYEQVMVILFRLLFVAYAEDKDLLPYRTNSHYADHSLKRLARRLTDDRHAGHTDYDVQATDFWDDVRQLWRAVDTGNSSWGVPAYDGGLFSHDPDISPAGAALASLQLTDSEFAPALAALLVDEGEEGYGPVDFRSLSVREFGTIYEGLLESRLAVAQDDLSVRRTKGQDQYVPASSTETIEVVAGGVYLHNRSGVRKATGSYFTKPFAVEHLLDHALEPALDSHVARLDGLRAAGDDAALAEAFFDFRCADIAMGSGHFLVAALDRIEARLSAWLALHPVPAVSAELNRLRDTALAALGDLGAGVEIETGSLLRRQVARHCIYGVDRNRVAAELARLSIWVHTFVPGLPLSLLDHNLIYGDSLTGVGTLDEVVTALDPDADPQAPSLFRNQIEGLLARAEGALSRLARTSDADKAEIDEAREAHAEARAAVEPARALFDLVAAHRAGACTLPQRFDEATLLKEAAAEEVRTAIRNLQPVHFPAAFPEVIRRENPGFDCLLGNPPWEKVVADREVWWGVHLPGVRSLPVSQRRARIDDLEAARPDLAAAFESDRARADDLKRILRATFPNLGSGQTDLYKAFSWANLAQASDGGRVGLVLPRSAVSDAGMANWRTHVVADNAPPPPPRNQPKDLVSVATLINHGGWVFEDVHRSYTVALVGITRSCPSPPASTPASGPSTMSTRATRSHSSRSVDDLGNHTTQGGGLEDPPHVAIYPGPAVSLEHFRRLIEEKPEEVPVAEFASWSATVAFPQVPTRAAFRVWRTMKQHPRFDGADLEKDLSLSLSLSLSLDSRGGGERDRSRATSTPPTIDGDSAATTDVAPPTDRRTPHHRGSEPVRERRWRHRAVREFDATGDRGRFVNDDGAAAARLADWTAGVWPVYTGKSFNLWEPDTGDYYDSVDAATITSHLQDKRMRQRRTRSSAFAEQAQAVTDDPTTLPCLRPRIAFRDIARATDTRTLIAALIPGHRVVVHKAPYLLLTAGTSADEAYLLGVLCSMPLDWQARRTVELTMDF